MIKSTTLVPFAFNDGYQMGHRDGFNKRSKSNLYPVEGMQRYMYPDTLHSFKKGYELGWMNGSSDRRRIDEASS